MVGEYHFAVSISTPILYHLKEVCVGCYGVPYHTVKHFLLERIIRE
jgi:hypothetical protein